MKFCLWLKFYRSSDFVLADFLAKLFAFNICGCNASLRTEGEMSNTMQQRVLILCDLQEFILLRFERVYFPKSG